MGAWEKLAEARVQEWQQRPAEERARAPRPPPAHALELQLLEEVLDLLDRAADEPDPEARASLYRHVESVQTRLLVLLETSGRPLAAQSFAQRIAEARARRGGGERP